MGGILGIRKLVWCKRLETCFVASYKSEVISTLHSVPEMGTESLSQFQEKTFNFKRTLSLIGLQIAAHRIIQHFLLFTIFPIQCYRYNIFLTWLSQFCCLSMALHFSVKWISICPCFPPLCLRLRLCVRICCVRVAAEWRIDIDSIV